jgi:hypothetical protein
MIYLSAAQRCSVLLTTNNETSQNFAIVGSMDTVSRHRSEHSSHAVPKLTCRNYLTISPRISTTMSQDGSYTTTQSHFLTRPP